MGGSETMHWWESAGEAHGGEMSLFRSSINSGSCGNSSEY